MANRWLHQPTDASLPINRSTHPMYIHSTPIHTPSPTAYNPNIRRTNHRSSGDKDKRHPAVPNGAEGNGQSHESAIVASKHAQNSGILKLRGLPFSSNEQDIQQFFEGVCETRNACVLCNGGPVADTTKGKRNPPTDRSITSTPKTQATPSGQGPSSLSSAATGGSRARHS